MEIGKNATTQECAVDAFRTELQIFIDAGAGDRETALRWMTDDETFYNADHVEKWVDDHGILYTDYGDNLVKELIEIVTFSEDG
jgi:hypothetical protein|tara:strand:- start:2246 stop:2497 length:252 start_codon:yes stop_codon:yes gene_type:complete